MFLFSRHFLIISSRELPSQAEGGAEVNVFGQDLGEWLEWAPE